jgi:hypothetical protein
MGAGLACTVVGLALSQTSLVPLRVIFLGLGLLLAGIAVAKRLQTAGWELEDRAESAGLLAVAAFGAMFGYMAMDESWDSGRVFFGVLIALALLASFVVLLPRPGRRIALLVLVLLHFGGILTAVTSVPPRNGPAPWISMQLWTHFYRYYLFFGYLTNAYHFYSPDPGPATLLWFHVEYADGKARWIKIPNRHESPVGLHHQRMLATTENTVNPAGFLLANQDEINAWEQRYKTKYELLPGIPHDTGEEIMKRRQLAADLYKFVDPQDNRQAPLMLLDELPPLANQFSEPAELSRRLISSFARHMAHTSPDPNDPHNAVKAVRVYRVVHTIITPRELYEGKDPLDPATFVPVYMGKYDPDGKLLDPKDPFLFWHVPYVRVPKNYPEPGTYLISREVPFPMLRTHWQPEPGEESKLIDFVEIHATQSDKFSQETPEK